MKILFCDNTLWGLVNFRGAVIAHFRDKGHEIVLVAPEKEDSQMQTNIPQGVKYIPIQMGRTSTSPWNDFKLIIHLLQVYKKERPDYIFHYTIKPNIYGSIAAKLCGIPSTAMVAGLGFAFSNQSIASRLAKILYKIGLHCTNRLFVLNEDNRQTILKLKLCQPEKIILLSGGEGIDCSLFHPLNNLSKTVTFLFIGRVQREKGYEEFVAAADIVKKQGVNAHFCILGSLDPSHPSSIPEAQLKADIQKGTIIYKGFVSNMVSVYTQPGLVITLPSYHEGMNRALMEACASGKPIITTNIAGCRELVDEGKNGFLVPVKDAQRLADAMLRYLSLNEEEQLAFSRHSRKIAEKKFNVEQVIQMYEDILNADISQKKSI